MGGVCYSGFCWMRRIKQLKKENDVIIKISESSLSELEISFILKKWYVIYLQKICIATASQRTKFPAIEIESAQHVLFGHHWNVEWIRPVHI